MDMHMLNLGVKQLTHQQEIKMSSTNTKKLKNMINLFNKKIGEPIHSIKYILGCTCIINDKWKIQLSVNEVDRYYPDPE